MRTKFELNEEVYVKGRITGIGIKPYTDNSIVYVVEVYDGDKIKTFEIADWQLERRVQQ